MPNPSNDLEYLEHNPVTAALATLPPQAQASPAIVAEVCRILDQSPSPGNDLAALRQRCQQAATVYYAPNTTINIVNSFNQTTDNRDYSDHSDHSTHTQTEPNYRMGLIFAAVGAAIYLGILQSAYLGGYVQGQRSTTEAHP